MARRFNSLGVIEKMADVMLNAGVPEYIRSDNGAEMTAKIVRRFAKLGAKMLYIEPYSPLGERLLRVLQRQATRRMLQRETVPQPEGSPRRGRAMAQALGHDPTALIAELPTIGGANDSI